MPPRSARLAELIFATASLVVACSFDANRLRGRVYQDAENPDGQNLGSGGSMGGAADGSPVSTVPRDAAPQDTPSVPSDVRVTHDVLAGDRAGAVLGGGGGSPAFDAQTSMPPDGSAPGGTTGGAGSADTRGAKDAGGALSTGGGGSVDTGGTSNAGGSTMNAGGSTSLGTGGTTSTGGTSGGGVTNTGGATSTGGKMNTGGATDSGGASDTGGVVASSGGMTSSGGALSTGGVPSSGGMTSSGGALSSGGVPSSGGMTNTGGVPSSGGTTSTSSFCATYTDLGTLPSTTNQYLAIPSAATCYRFTVTAPQEVIRGIQMSNCGSRTVAINGTDSSCTPASNCIATTSLARSADGYWYLLFSATTATLCSSTWWWSP